MAERLLLHACDRASESFTASTISGAGVAGVGFVARVRLDDDDVRGVTVDLGAGPAHLQPVGRGKDNKK